MTESPPPTRMRWMRPFTTNVFNRLSRHFAGWMPLFGIIEHVGRKSGTTYRTPFRRDSRSRTGHGTVSSLPETDLTASGSPEHGEPVAVDDIVGLDELVAGPPHLRVNASGHAAVRVHPARSQALEA